MSTIQEIQHAIIRLAPQDRVALRQWLDDSEEETPEMLDAIDEGIRSLREKPMVPLEDVRRKISGWATKSN